MLRREQGWAFQGPHPDIWRLESSNELQPSYVTLSHHDQQTDLKEQLHKHDIW
jgi:hypothetical protein